MIYDAVVLVILFVSALIAFFRGLIREILTITGVVGGAIAAVYLGPLLSPTVRGWVTPEKPSKETPDKFMDLIPFPLLGDVLAYSFIFIFFVIVFSLFFHFYFLCNCFICYQPFLISLG
jgi:membrane protein required for colicin V production